MRNLTITMRVKPFISLFLSPPSPFFPTVSGSTTHIFRQQQCNVRSYSDWWVDEYQYYVTCYCKIKCTKNIWIYRSLLFWPKKMELLLLANWRNSCYNIIINCRYFPIQCYFNSVANTSVSKFRCKAVCIYVTTLYILPSSWWWIITIIILNK